MDSIFMKQLYSSNQIKLGKAFCDEFKIDDPELVKAEDMGETLAIIGAKYLIE